MQDTQIYERGITLSDGERRRINDNAWSMSKKIALILKNRSPQGYTVEEMTACLKSILGVNRVNDRSVQRAMSTMTGTKNAPEKLRDKYGRYPLVKLDEKRLSPSTGVKVHVFAWNSRYKQPPSHRELVEKQKRTGQMNFHKDLFN